MQKFANDFFFFIFFLSLVLIFNCWNWKPNKNNERALVLSHSGLFFVCRIKRSRRPSWKSRKACKKKPSDLRPILTTPITSFSDRTRTRLHPPPMSIDSDCDSGSARIPLEFRLNWFRWLLTGHCDLDKPKRKRKKERKTRHIWPRFWPFLTSSLSLFLSLFSIKQPINTLASLSFLFLSFSKPIDWISLFRP